MSYVAKTDWKHDDPVTEQDLNRWETGIKENTEKLGTVQEFALTTASGDAKESITNVNTATTVGLFLVASNATGAPTTAVGLLYVWRRGSSHLLQEYWEISSNKQHHRTSTDNGATWTTWQTIANTDVATTSKNGLMSSSDKTALDNAQKVKLTENDGTVKGMPASNANLVTEPGVYSVAVNSVNVPMTYGTITHIKRHVENFIQLFQSNAESIMFVRAYNSGVWSPWKRITDNSILGGILLGNKLVDTQTANFVGKVSGSTTVNQHKASRFGGSTSLLSPSSASWLELTDSGTTSYTNISNLDEVLNTLTTNSNGVYAQQLFSFNLIEHVQRTYGTIPGATTADKVAWLKSNISKATCNWWGYGTNQNGSKASLTKWSPRDSQYYGTLNHTSSAINKISNAIVQGSMDAYIDNNGFVHFLAFADPSDGVTASVLNTDYVELQIELSTSLKDNMKPVWIDATLQNGWVAFDSSQTPRYAIDSSGIVLISGAVKSGTLPQTIFTLPSGYRPLKTTYLMTSGSTGNIYRVTLNTDGRVYVEQSVGNNGNAFVSFDGIRFPTN